jgi:predicted PurR-regulated permease PerM
MKRDNLIFIPLGIIAFFVVGIVLQDLRALLLPFAIAVLFSILFHPVVTALNQRKVPVAFSLLAVLALFGSTMFVLGGLLYSSALPLIQELPEYQDKLDQTINNAGILLGDIIRTLGLKAEHIDLRTVLGVTTVTADAISTTLLSFIDFLGKAALVLLFMLFMLAGTGELQAKVLKAYPSELAKAINTGLYKIGVKVRRYLVIRILLSGLTGLLTLLLLWILGVGFPVFWGFLAFLLSFIPTVGSLLAVGLPIIFALLQFDQLTRPVLVILLLSIVHMVMGNVVQPKLMATTLNLSPLLVLVALIFWGLLWGPWGMILAIPLTTTIKIVFENIETLKPISLLMSAKTNQ